MADFQEAANNAPPLEYSEAAPMERVTSRRMGRVPSRFRNTKEADVVKPTVNGEEESRRQSMKFSAKAFITKFAGDLEKYYEIGELLGSGGYGQVFSCKYKETGSIRAVKVIAKSDFEEDNKMVIDEFNILKQLDHPNILKNYALFETKENFYIVTDLYKGGELFDHMAAGLTEEEVAVLMKSVLSCINYCHREGIVHRDLKPENILLEENHDLTQIKIIDFGLAALFNGSHFSFDAAAGSSYYMSPQVLRGNYNFKCDIWSCGVVAYMMLAGYAPFDGDSDEEIADQIEEGAVYFDHPVWDSMSDDALDFIDYLLTYEEDERPTADEALQHPWLQQSRKSIDEELSERDSARLSLASLQSFSASFKLKQCACSLIASQILPKEVKQEINRVFQALDLDCDGKLTPDDIRQSYEHNFGVKLDDDDVAEIFNEVNYSGTGSIQYSEFIVASMLEKNLVTEEMLEVAFQLLDKDGSGLLGFEDLKEALDVDDEMSCYVKNRIIKPVDSDGDGMISFEDFKAMFDTDLPDSSDEDHTRIVRIHKDEAPLRPLRRMSIRDSFRTSIKMTTSMDLEQLEFLPSESRESVSRRAVRVNSNAGRDSVLGSVIHTTSSANSRRPSRSSFRGSIRGSLIRTTSNANHSSTNMLRNLLDTFDSIPSKDGDDV